MHVHWHPNPCNPREELPHPLGRQYGRGPRNSRHSLLVVVDLCIIGRMIGQEQKRTLTTFFDFSDVTLAFEDKIKDWPNGWKCNLCDNRFNSDHRHSAHRDRSHRGRYRTVWYSMIKSIAFLSSFFKQVSHVIKIGGKSDT